MKCKRFVTRPRPGGGSWFQVWDRRRRSVAVAPLGSGHVFADQLSASEARQIAVALNGMRANQEGSNDGE